MTSPGLVLHHEIRDDHLSISLIVHPVVNLALVHNGVPLVQQVQVRNEGDEPFHEVHVAATLVGLTNGDRPDWSASIDQLQPGAAKAWDLIHDLTPSRAHLQEQSEAYAVELVVEVTRPGADALVLRIPVRVLAHNEWFAAEFCLESLATFVEPNDPAITSVLSDAANILEKNTGDSSLQGYQAGPERAGTIAAAIYAALTARNIRYISAPASFENHGQKVLSPKQVLDERFGACLDLTTLYASCLERAHLNPLLWIVDGHAFVGFMREDSTLPNPVVLEPNQMLNLAESERAIIVEASFYGGAQALTFRKAVEHAQKHLATPDKHLGIVDVRAARRAGVRPFPRSVSTENSPDEEQLQHASPAAVDLSLPESLTSTRESDQVLDATDDSPPRVKRWKRALLDLSTRNRLLNLRPSREVVYLTVDGATLAMADDLVHAGKKITLRPGDDLAGVQKLSGVHTADDLDPGEVLDLLRKRKEMFAKVSSGAYTRTLKHLQRTARTLLEETGSTNLYLTFGSLVHRTSSGTEARAPLFLLPVRVVGGTGNARFEIVADTSGIAAPNHCLTEWLRVAHNVVIDDLSTPPVDDSGIDIVAAIRGTRQGLIDNNLNFRVDTDAAIAICKFGTFGMWRDLQKHWPEIEKSPLVRHLTYTPGGTFTDPETTSDAPLDSIEVDEVAEPLPVHYDGSQLKAVELAAKGRTFVLQGPPGTGKSQTITNLIARNLSAGRSVLFVAEKQAALDVVRTRLEKVGLGPFTLNLHGAGQKSDSIRAQIKTSLDFKAHHNDRRWQTDLAQWRQNHAQLDRYPDLIHSANSVDDSLWRAADAIASAPGAPYVEVPARFAANGTPEQVAQVRNALVAFGRLASPALTRPENPWTVATTIDQATLQTANQQAALALSQVLNNPVAATIATALDDSAAIDLLIARADIESRGTQVTQQQLTEFSTPDWAHRYDAAKRGLDDLRRQSNGLTRVFNGAFLASGDSATLATALREAQQGLLRKKRRAEEARTQLRAALLPGVDLPLDQAPALLDQIPSLRSQAEYVRNALVSVLAPHLPSSWHPLSPGAEQSLATVDKYLDQTWAFARQNPQVWQTLRASGSLDSAAVQSLRSLTTAWREFARAVGATPESLGRWRRGRNWLEAWQATQSQWTADVAEHGPAIVTRTTELEDSLAPLRQSGLDSIADDLMAGQIPPGEAEARFLVGLSRASITERMDAGALGVFHRKEQDGRVDDFAAASDRMREQLRETLPSRLAAMRPFDPDHLTGSYGKLRRSLDGKRNAATVRSLVRDYGPEIQSATPCFLVSPTSLAQYVPPGSIMFDLVVFDEASQVTVAQSIGAIGRARSAVIVGDPKQMPPTMIGVATGGTSDDDDEEEEGEATFEDLESILDECLDSGVPPINLTWHYRSEDESLIAFSNEKYYESRLATLPSPGASDDAGTELRRVNGHFNREDKKVDYRTNRVEAEAIVAEIRQRVAQDPSRSIGVVTFNRQQQDMILNLLEDSKDKAVLELLAPDAEDGLFVKNLENVQGDERDIIMFSTAFSKTAEGGQLPLNFGPLNNVGGERRLNVAVTRARRKVIIFSSFDPSDIDLNRTRSKGMADLRAYLETAAANTVRTTSTDSVGTSGLEEDIASALRARGYEVRRNYGMSDFVVDIAVRAPDADRWQVAVMLDGPKWGERATVNDRDLTPRLLGDMMGWHSVERVWLPEWLHDRDAVLQRISDAVAVAELERSEAERAGAGQSAPMDHTGDEPAPAEPESVDAVDDDVAGVIDHPVASDESQGLTPTSLPNAVPTDSAPVAPVDDPVSSDNDTAEDQSAALADTGGARPLVSTPIAYATPASDLPPIVVTNQPSENRSGRKVDEAGSETRRRSAATPQLYVRVDDSPLGDPDDLESGSRAVRQVIQEAILDMLNSEGPISRDRLCRRIVHRFGFQKAHAPRRDHVAGQIPRHLRQVDSDLGTFVWPEDLDPSTWSVFQISDAYSPDKRSFEDISPEEIINALEHTAAQGVRDQDDLVRRTVAEFGVIKVSQAIRARTESCISLAMSTNRITINLGSSAATTPDGSDTARPSEQPQKRTDYNVRITDLIDAGLLTVGDTVRSKDHRTEATVLEAGFLKIGEQIFSTPSKAAVHANSGISTNGWPYWFTADGVTFDELRKRFLSDRGPLSS